MQYVYFHQHIFVLMKKLSLQKCNTFIFISAFCADKKNHPWKNAIRLFSSGFFSADDKTVTTSATLIKKYIEKVKHLDGIQQCITFKFLHFAVISFFLSFPES